MSQRRSLSLTRTGTIMFIFTTTSSIGISVYVYYTNKQRNKKYVLYPTTALSDVFFSKRACALADQSVEIAFWQDFGGISLPVSGHFPLVWMLVVSSHSQGRVVPQSCGQDSFSN